MDINRVIIIGNIVREVDLRFLPNGNAVANFTLAVNDGYGNNKTVDFIKVTAWKKTAENVANYCGKGSKVAVEGKIKQQTWKDKDGNNREKVYVNAQTIMFLNTKQQGSNDNDDVEEYLMDSDSYREGESVF